MTAGVSLSLEGKVALVTGGSRGIGAATVRLLRQAGARVIFSYRSAGPQARALQEECGGETVCRALRQDLQTAEDGQALVRKAAEVFGRIDCLIVNHGVWPPHDQPIETMGAAQWSGTMGVNLNSVFGLVQAGAGQMLRQTAEDATNSARGHIVLVASTAAQRGEAFHADYAASKGALLSLTKSLSSELGPQVFCAIALPPAGCARKCRLEPLPTRLRPRKHWDLSRWAGPPSRRRSPGPSSFCVRPGRASSPARYGT